METRQQSQTPIRTQSYSLFKNSTIQKKLFLPLLGIIILIAIVGAGLYYLAPKKAKAFKGTIKTGAQIGEVKNHCKEGLYLVAQEGEYLTDHTQMLQLRTKVESGETKLFTDQNYINKQVAIIGQYPAQEVFCEALTCQCEDYILVKSIDGQHE